ncbi:MAG TPA: diguanylate cyclase [Novosphingobium sp.]|nr:diguanylate cyclase [Novosphingobium sp.]
MRAGRTIGIALAMAAAWLLGLAMPSAASADVLATANCHASATLAEDYDALARAPDRWRCSSGDWELAADRTLIRFAVAPGAPQPNRFVTRVTRFAALKLTVIAADGTRATHTLSSADMQPGTRDWLMLTALPRIDRPIVTVVAEIDGARHLGMLGKARIERATAATPTIGRFELIMAGLCGLLCAPFLFNLAFYRVLRERFLIWHTCGVGLMLAQMVITSGLINHFAALSIDTLCILSAGTFGGGAICAAMFGADLIEPDKLDPLHRRLLAATAPWIAGFTLFYLFGGETLRGLAASIYYLSFVPIIALFCWVMGVALHRGSRAVRFQIAAWTPFLLVGAVRVGTSVATDGNPLALDFEQHLAIVAEILITALAVVDRFMVLRRQRDHARFETRQLEQAVARDPLTGLFNRRGIEGRFEKLRSAGFDTLAVIDLDNFKAINDARGHAVGDQVLAATGLALQDDPDLIAWRLGGEEFLLLLRGSNATRRAEARRQAIPTRVATLVPGLPGPVTASMGVIELPRGTMLGSGYAELYAHADRLLYEAKRAGRNRMIAEKLTVFAGNERRVATAA